MVPITWFKVDDNLAFHHKTVAAGNAAMGLWVRAGALCASQLTDGFVPDHMMRALGKPSEARALVSAGLWTKVSGGFLFHQWSEDGRQPTREQVEAERRAARERMAARRRSKANGSGEVRANTNRTNGEVRGVFGDPDPTRPDPTRSSSGTTPPAGEPAKPAKRAQQLPADFVANDTNRRLAGEHGVDLERILPQFLDHHRAKGSTFKDWHAALNTWIRREQPAPRGSQNGRGGLSLAYLRPEEIEEPPDGLSPQAYAEWDTDRRRRLAEQRAEAGPT